MHVTSLQHPDFIAHNRHIVFYIYAQFDGLENYLNQPFKIALESQELQYLTMNTNYSLSGKAIVTTVAQSSSYLVLGLDDGHLHVFSTQGEVLYKLRAEVSPSSLAVRQHQLIVGCRDGSIESWDLFTGYVLLAGLPS